MPTLGMIRQFFSFIKNNVPVLILPFLNDFIFENSPFQSSTKYFVTTYIYQYIGLWLLRDFNKGLKNIRRQ